MRETMDARPRTGRAAGDGYYDRHAAELAPAATDNLPADNRPHHLDSAQSREEHKRLLEWYYFEKDRQASNRMEMATDADFYDNIQWAAEDAAILEDRGQMALVFNEVAPMCDWLIGTERRTRVDWRVLPRTEDDVKLADVKTNVLKYVSDVNRVPFNRSRAFADAIKAGVGWIDDGVRDDPTQEPIYSRYEDWRNVLHDSSGYELDLSDGRYLFRWRWVDEDIAIAMFPDRAQQIRQAVQDAAHALPMDAEEETWYSETELAAIRSSGVIFAGGTAAGVDATRRRVRLIECQYRKPTKTKIISAGPLKGAMFNENDGAMISALNQRGGSIIDKVIMRVHVAVFTETHMLSMGETIFRHNRFSLTPIWCYRRGRDRLPYGVIRRVRDIQRDLNKRASKAQWIMNTNQVIADEGAADDMETLREEANRPDGLLIKRAGKDVTIRRDTDAATGQIQMMAMNAQSIQKSGGVADENLGRQTNAVSGEAIKARQLQGSVVTTEPFDNLRLAIQVSGEKQLAMTEQFYTEEKVIRLSGIKGSLEWAKINQPETQPDGSVRFINDITQSMADFVVSDADYAGNMRQVMYESIAKLAERMPDPSLALRLMTIAFEFSDMPNKDDIADQFRRITGETDPDKELSPEEQQAAQEKAQQQAEALEMQRQQAINALEEQQAKIREINARAMKLEAEAKAAMAGDSGQADAAIGQVRQQAAQEIERLAESLRQAQAEAANKTLQIRSSADTAIETARIKAATDLQVAEIQAASDERMKALQAQLDQVMAYLDAASEKKQAATK